MYYGAQFCQTGFFCVEEAFWQPLYNIHKHIHVFVLSWLLSMFIIPFIQDFDIRMEWFVWVWLFEKM